MKYELPQKKPLVYLPEASSTVNKKEEKKKRFKRINFYVKKDEIIFQIGNNLYFRFKREKKHMSIGICNVIVITC